MQVNSKRKFINVNFTMSYEEYDEGFTMPEFHFHNDFEIYILERGERIVSVGGEEIFTCSGDVMLFGKEELHKSKGVEGFSGICIHFSERFLKRYFTDISINKMMKIFHIRKLHIDAENLILLKKITEEFVIDDDNNFLRLAKIFEILHSCLNTEKFNHQPESYKLTSPLFTDTSYINSSNASTHKKASQLFTYVDENYAYIKGLKELADLFQISESYLFRLFQNEYGMTPKTYLNKLKIQNICHSLKYSNAPIKNIAAAYGFDSYEHFYRVFKKEIGCTPTEYRLSLSHKNT